MVDRLTPEKRSWNMSLIRSKNTKPERILRSLLHRMGYRFRLSHADIKVKPDIIFPTHRLAIFVHGCYWHRHPGCKNATTPKTRTDFWQKKFDDNIRRDKQAEESLTRLGWKVVVIWECEIEGSLGKVADRIKQELRAVKGWDMQNTSNHSLAAENTMAYYEKTSKNKRPRKKKK